MKPWLIEDSGVVLNSFTLSLSLIFTEVSPIKLEDLPVPPFKAVLYLVSCVRKAGNTVRRKSDTKSGLFSC